MEEKNFVLVKEYDFEFDSGVKVDKGLVKDVYSKSSEVFPILIVPFSDANKQMLQYYNSNQQLITDSILKNAFRLFTSEITFEEDGDLSDKDKSKELLIMPIIGNTKDALAAFGVGIGSMFPSQKEVLVCLEGDFGELVGSQSELMKGLVKEFIAQARDDATEADLMKYLKVKLIEKKILKPGIVALKYNLRKETFSKGLHFPFEKEAENKFRWKDTKSIPVETLKDQTFTNIVSPFKNLTEGFLKGSLANLMNNVVDIPSDEKENK